MMAIAAIPIINIFYTWAAGDIASDIIVHNIIASALFNNSPSPEIVEIIEKHRHIYAYMLYHLVVKVVQIFIEDNYALSSTIVLVYSTLATMLIVRLLFTNFLKNHLSVAKQYLVDVISIFSVFFFGIGGFLTGGVLYLSVGSPNVWHNPTTILSRPIMLFAFYIFIKAFEQLKLGEKPIVLLTLFSALLVLSAYAKPSFAIVLVPAMGLYIAVYILKDFKNRLLNVGIPLLLSVIPLIVVLIAQYLYVRANSSSIETSFGFAPGFGRDPSTSLPLTFAVGATLSLFIIIIYIFTSVGYKHVKEEGYYVISLVASLIGWFQAYFLYQTGVSAGDYFWGYMLAVHLATIMSLYILIKYSKGIVLYMGLSIYAVQVVQGIRYFYNTAYESGGGLV